MAYVRINGKVNLKAHFDQAERKAIKNCQAKDSKPPKKAEDPYETIKLIQKNLKGDFDEIIAEKNIYACLLHTEIKSPLYHIEKLSELVGKAKAIIRSKVYKSDRRAALQKAIDLFDKVKNRLSGGILEELKNAAHKRQISETYTQYADSPTLDRSFSTQEIFSRNIRDSINLNRQRIGHNITETLSQHSDKSEDKSDDEIDNFGNTWTRNRLSSTSTHSSTHSKQDNIYMPFASRFTPCISPPLSRVTPHYQNLNQPSATPCISPPLPSATPLYTFNDPPLADKANTTICDEMDEIESIQETLKNLKKFENYDGKSSDTDDESDCGTKHYYYVDGDLAEFSNSKPNQSINSTDTSINSTNPENNDWNFLKLTEQNLANFDTLNQPKKIINEKVEATKRKIDDVTEKTDKKEEGPKTKKTKTRQKKDTKDKTGQNEKKKIKKIKLVRENKFYFRNSPEVYKIVQKYDN